ncbi:MAG: thioredoxin domain-containing protein, partial [Acidobacteriota bacterium]|nr:thioredoxin domain-containing protein [Acidobacteriota bacterium]
QDRERILQSSAEVMEELRRQASSSASGPGVPDLAVCESAFQQFRRSFDSRLGGFGHAPKFPRPSVLNFLLRYWKRTGNDEALDMVATTLIAMSKGGMNDQLGGGFHRYSVDAYWFVPHFEKMLYDQAQLAVAYLEGFQATGNDAMESAARQTLDYVMRDMTAPEGAFWSAEDADSASDAAQPTRKSEGFFYIWSWREAVELLGEEHAQWFAYRYGMERLGNVQNDPHQEFTGLNILFQAHTLADVAAHFDRQASEIAAALAEADRKLFETRAKRPRPHLDDKILTAWNGMMISAFAKAGAVLGEAKYTEAARRAADFILQRLRTPDGALLRRYRQGDAGIAGMLDDYAFFAQALLDLYESTFEFSYLTRAVELTGKQRELFEDRESGGFFASAQEDAVSLMRVKDDYDGAEPSGNSIALLNLLRLHRMTGLPDYGESASKLVAAFSSRAANAPHGLPQMLCAWEYDAAEPKEIVVAGIPEKSVTRLLWRNFDPNRIVLKTSAELARYQPAVSAMTGPAVYVCRNFACNRPVSTVEDLAPLLE